METRAPERRHGPKVVRTMLFLFGGAVLAALLLAGGLVLARSPGRPPPFLDSAGRPLEGSISEKLHVRINGVEQGMFIAGKDRRRPVLLFVHGGPGMPEYAISLGYASVLEELFTVCWWEQRGAGLSSGPEVPRDSITMEQLVADTIEVTRYLRARFGQERIFLVGHSWGSAIAIQAAAREPSLYAAYVGMAQVTQQLDSEKEAWTFMIEAYRRRGDARMVRALESTPIPSLGTVPESYRGLRDKGMHELGIGTTRAMRSVITGLFVPVWMSPVYTVGEKVALWRAKWSAASSLLFARIIAADVPALVPRLEVPAYFLHGAHDLTTSYALARRYFAALEAPRKGFYTFRESAHSPLFEEPERAMRILRDDVLAGAHALSDPG